MELTAHRLDLRISFRVARLFGDHLLNDLHVICRVRFEGLRVIRILNNYILHVLEVFRDLLDLLHKLGDLLIDLCYLYLRLLIQLHHFLTDLNLQVLHFLVQRIQV